MNNKRRAKLKTALDLMERASDIISEAMYEEQDSLDNMPENLQASERYEKIEDSAEKLSDASTCIYDAIENLREAIE